MCGIAGSIQYQGNPDRSSLKKASDQMIYRGPDDEGSFFEGPAALVHRRLSIIDIEGGAQPMFNEDKSLVLVFNGEIYNFMSLRADLQEKGHIFSSFSDTEVILHGFEEWGPDCVNRLHGMFAFALYDRRDKSLFLSRDRCGEKPLYYAHEGKSLFFASEIPALMFMLEQTPEPDPESIYLYLRLGYVPAPRSFFKGVRKLQPGHSAMFKKGVFERWAYYKPERKVIDHEVGEAELCEELNATLSHAVKQMLVSDVPLGAFLSGGLDSSLIVALMKKEGGVPETFSIAFDEESFDESRYAMRVAEYLGTKHTHFKVAFDDFDSCLSIMDVFGEPFSDSSGIPTFYLARETRRKVKVALSGDGGDELFGGYRRYMAQNLAKYYISLPRSIRKGLIRFLSLFSEGDEYYADSFIKSAKIFVGRAESTHLYPGVMFNMVFTHHEVESLFPKIPDGRKLIKEYIGLDVSEKVEALMHADRVIYLPDDILVKVDRMSMKNSLEIRAPYLHPDVLEISERIPLSLKIRGKNLKYLLKKVALKYLPPDIVYRKKHGFMAPLPEWIRQAGEKYIRRRIPPWTSQRALDKILKPHFNRRADNSHKIFTLLMLGRYFK